jgi:hypothetical protein
LKRAGFAGGPRVLIPPMIVWLLVQLAALLVATLRTPLAAQYPQPGEFQAVPVMLVAQFSALAILFPWMLRTWGSALAVLTASWAMLFAAAVLSVWTIRDIVPLGAFVAVWIVIFSTLAQIRLAPMQSIVMAVAALWVLGGPLVWYLHLEFAPGSSARPDAWYGYGPLLAAIATTPHLPPSAWAAACGVECLALLVWKADSWMLTKSTYRRVGATAAEFRSVF